MKNAQLIIEIADTPLFPSVPSKGMLESFQYGEYSVHSDSRSAGDTANKWVVYCSTIRDSFVLKIHFLILISQNDTNSPICAPEAAASSRTESSDVLIAGIECVKAVPACGVKTSETG